MRRLYVRAFPVAHPSDGACIFVPDRRDFRAGEALLLSIRRRGWPCAVVVGASVMATQRTATSAAPRRGVWILLADNAHRAISNFEAVVTSNAELAQRRRHERLPLALPVRAVVAGQTYNLTTQDISAGGAALLGMLPPTDEVVPLTVEMPGRPLTLHARLVYQRPTANGGFISGAAFTPATNLGRTLRTIVSTL